MVLCLLDWQADKGGQRLTSPCDCAPTPVILGLPALEVVVLSKSSFCSCWVRLSLCPQHKGRPLPEGSLSSCKASLVLIA